MNRSAYIDMIAQCTTVAQTQTVERQAFGGRRWQQHDADLIRLAAIAKRVELTHADHCATFTQPSTPLSRGAGDSTTRRKERTHVRNRT